MAKRFTDTDKWTGNKWFRKLSTKHKLFWFFILDSCDSVGVWEEDIELVELLTGEEYDKKEILNLFEKQIKIINNGKKWWIMDFCDFQYGELKEKNINNRPHQSYIHLLKRHRLWIDYTKSIKGLSNSLKEKEKDKEKEKEKDKDKKKEYAKFVKMTEEEYKKLVDEYDEDFTKACIVRLNNYKGANGKTYKSDYLAILNWVVTREKQTGEWENET